MSTDTVWNGPSDEELAAIDRSVYLDALEELKRTADNIENTPMFAVQKINTLILLNMRWEQVFKNGDLEGHPFDHAVRIIEQATQTLRGWDDIAFIESTARRACGKDKPTAIETKHRALFQDLWVNFSEDDYQERIERYLFRLKVNNMFDGFLAGKRCIDLGCGHGNFAHALVRAGADHVLGIDYGEKSIAYAERARKALAEDRVSFSVGSVYGLPIEDCSFDFAVQNGVFHHLEDEDRAISEALRVLRPGAQMWYYTDGKDGVSYHLWDASVYILREISHELILEHLAYLNVSTGKHYHLGDGLNATYRHTSWDEITRRLRRLGFINCRRLVGGYDTDFDVSREDKYSVDKFGSGDLRILADKK